MKFVVVEYSISEIPYSRYYINNEYIFIENLDTSRRFDSNINYTIYDIENQYLHHINTAKKKRFSEKITEPTKGEWNRIGKIKVIKSISEPFKLENCNCIERISAINYELPLIPSAEIKEQETSEILCDLDNFFDLAIDEIGMSILNPICDQNAPSPYLFRLKTTHISPEGHTSVITSIENYYEIEIPKDFINNLLSTPNVPYDEFFTSPNY